MERTRREAWLAVRSSEPASASSAVGAQFPQWKCRASHNGWRGPQWQAHCQVVDDELWGGDTNRVLTLVLPTKGFCCPWPSCEMTLMER